MTSAKEMTEYPPSEYLPLSGIQHFVFCRRQWALIHIEQQWQDNALTAEGRLLHRRADDPFFTEKRGDLLIARSVPVASSALGLTGVCDVVEFRAAARGVRLPGRDGFYQPVPVEYKRGRKKSHQADEAQLCAQALCLEEMLAVNIPSGYIFYKRTQNRVPVAFTPDLRERVVQAAAEMHAYARRGHTPKVRPSRACRACSLAEICLPDLQNRRTTATRYIQEQVKNA